jgi:hypothetical protein
MESAFRWKGMLYLTELRLNSYDCNGTEALEVQKPRLSSAFVRTNKVIFVWNHCMNSQDETYIFIICMNKYNYVYITVLKWLFNLTYRFYEINLWFALSLQPTNSNEKTEGEALLHIPANKHVLANQECWVAVYMLLSSECQIWQSIEVGEIMSCHQLSCLSSLSCSPRSHQRKGQEE